MKNKCNKQMVVRVLRTPVAGLLFRQIEITKLKGHFYYTIIYCNVQASVVSVINQCFPCKGIKKNACSIVTRISLT